MLNGHRSSFIFSLFTSDWVLLIAVLARFATPLTADISYLILAIYALFGNQNIIKALIFSWFFNMLNTNLVPNPEYATIGRYLVIFFSFISVIIRMNFKKIDKLILYTLSLGFFFIAHSIFFSSLPQVSILKAINWTLTIVTLMAAWSSLSLIQHEVMKQWILGFLLSVAIISLPTFFFPEIAYSRSGSGFQGIISHPMVFGPTMSLLGAIILGQLLEQKSPSLYLILVFIGVFVLAILSESRTAVVALVFAALLSLFFILFFTTHSLRNFFPALRSSVFLIISVLIVLLILIDSQLNNFIDYFISKSNQAAVEGLIDAYQVSRGVLYEPMIENIIKFPITGIGFGIASDPQSMKILYDPFFGLPVRAPTEKGVTPIMVLEEVGIPGFIFFIFWLFALFWRAVTNGIITLMLLSTLLLLNMSESTLFSPGGAGLLIIVFVALISCKPKILEKQSAKNIKT